MDKLIADRLNAKYKELIEKLRKILEEAIIPNEEEVEQARDIWLEYLTYSRAYAHIKSDEARKKYVESYALPVEEEGKKAFDDAQQRILISTKNARDASPVAKDAFSVLGTISNTEVTDREMLRRLDQFLRFSVGRTTPTDMKLDDSTDMLRKAMKYIWAYTQIGIREDRNVYTYKLAIADKVDEINRACSTVKNAGIRHFQQIDQKTLKDKDDESTITITATDKRQFGTFIIPNENEVGIYLVNGKNADGEFKFDICADIDFDRMDHDPRYVRRLKKFLLTPEVMAFAKENLGGYVGELDQEGKLVIDPEKAAACIMAQRALKKQEKQGDNSRTAKLQDGALVSSNGEPDGQDQSDDDNR